MSPLLRARLVVAAALLLPTGTGLVLRDLGRYDVAAAELRDRKRSVQARLVEVRAAEKQREHLSARSAAAESDLGRLELLLPSRVSSEEFVAAVRERTSPLDVRVLVNDFRIDRRAEPAKAELSIIVKGSDESLEAFPASFVEWRRLTKYRELERGPGWRLAVLTTWEAPEFEEPAPFAFALNAPAPFLPPIAWKNTAARRDLEACLRELGHHREAAERLSRFEARNRRLLAKVDVINALLEREFPERLK